MPNKKNKNQPKNAFYFYMLSLKPILQRQGVVLENGMQSLAEFAGPRWKDLPEHEKEVFQDMAKQAKANRRHGQPRNDRRDCTGQLLSQRVDAVSLNDTKRRRQRDEVKSSWPPGKLVCDEQFYLIGFMSLSEPSDEVQLPCELGVAEFSINSGIIKTMHRFIKPGQIPLGYRYQCTSISEKTHKIPLDGLAKERDSYYNIFMDLLGFVNYEASNSFPPVYARASETAQTEVCLDWLAMNAGMPNRIKKVYELEGLVCDLYEHPVKGEGLKISKAQATELISSTVFDYEPGARCKWHEEEEVKYCALGTVKRSCFCMADFLCPHYNIKLTPNHMPERPDEAIGVVINEGADVSGKKDDMYGGDDFTYPAYTQTPSFGRGYGQFNNQYSRSGPTYENMNLVSEPPSKPQQSWYQRTIDEENEKVPSKFSAAANGNVSRLFALGRGRGRGRGAPPINTLGPANLPQQASDMPGFVSRGRGFRVPNTKPKVYAGTANAPPPSAAPAPPLTWQQLPQHPYLQNQGQFNNQRQSQDMHRYYNGQSNQSWQQGGASSGLHENGSVDDIMRMMSSFNMVSQQ